MLNQTLVLFFLLVIGFTIRKLKIIDKHFNQNLTNLIMNVTLPALIINSLNYKFSFERLLQMGTVLTITIGIYLMMIVSSYFIMKYLNSSDEQAGVYQFVLIFGNTAFMGYPVIDVMYGEEGLFLAVIYNLIFLLLTWTLGIIIISQNEEESKFSYKQLINSGTVAIIIGLVLFAFSIELPQVVNSTLEMLASTTTPLAMITVGATLASVDLGQSFYNLKLWLTSLIRLLVYPLIALVILKLVTVNDLVLGVEVILTGMPAAVTGAIFAQEFGGDASLASEAVFLTTLLSVVTIPLLFLII